MDLAQVISGFAVGAIVGVTGVGGDSLMTPLLVLLFGVAPATAVGTDLLYAVPLTLVAGLGHWWLGSVEWTLLATLLTGSLPGIWLGSHLAHRIPERVLHPTLPFAGEATDRLASLEISEGR